MYTTHDAIAFQECAKTTIANPFQLHIVIYNNDDLFFGKGRYVYAGAVLRSSNRGGAATTGSKLD